MSGKAQCVALLSKILVEIENLPAGPFWLRDIKEEKYHFPILLFVDVGESIFITPSIDNMLRRLSVILMDTYFHSHRDRFTDSEWDAMARRAFGFSLSGHCKDMSPEENAEAILATVKTAIDGRISGIQEREYVFGCHVTNVSELKPISIGPVLFEPRVAWLTRVHGEGKISKISCSRLKRAWQGKKLRKRKHSKQAWEERHILDTIGNGEFVCSVTVGPMGSETGLQNALIAARIATTAISLGWSTPSSALKAMTLIYDREPRPQECMVFWPGGQIGGRSSRSFMPGGVIGLNAERWEELRSKLSDVFNCAGEAIRHVTHGHNLNLMPALAQSFFQALLWFHEGCRETSDVMAIVKYCSSMEALRNGKGLKGINDLIKAHVKPADKNKLRKDVKKLYKVGRSRTVHGTNYRLGYDWSSYRVLAETLARVILIACLQRAAEQPKSDDPDFLVRRTP